MNGPDLKIIADILEELKIRWRGDLSQANLANVRSFLSFRLKGQDSNFTKWVINYILTKEV